MRQPGLACIVPPEGLSRLFPSPHGRHFHALTSDQRTAGCPPANARPPRLARDHVGRPQVVGMDQRSPALRVAPGTGAPHQDALLNHGCPPLGHCLPTALRRANSEFFAALGPRLRLADRAAETSACSPCAPSRTTASGRSDRLRTAHRRYPIRIERSASSASVRLTASSACLAATLVAATCAPIILVLRADHSQARLGVFAGPFCLHRKRAMQLTRCRPSNRTATRLRPAERPGKREVMAGRYGAESSASALIAVIPSGACASRQRRPSPPEEHTTRNGARSKRGASPRKRNVWTGCCTC